MRMWVGILAFLLFVAGIEIGADRRRLWLLVDVVLIAISLAGVVINLPAKR